VPVEPERSLVPGELRGYRQFLLQADGLHPLVHRSRVPWDGRLERAVCAVGGDHEAPARDCRCGLYAWYRPGGGPLHPGACRAVVLAQGRCVLGDRGFRASAARVEAVALPPIARWWPPAAARTRALLARVHPDAVVHRTTRQMVRAHPPQDVTGLGVVVTGDPGRLLRWVLGIVLGLVALLGWALMLFAPALVQAGASRWPLLVVGGLVLQALLVALLRGASRRGVEPPG
jgi:hypothetical protein